MNQHVVDGEKLVTALQDYYGLALNDAKKYKKEEDAIAMVNQYFEGLEGEFKVVIQMKGRDY
jgi:hypothetical protein